MVKFWFPDVSTILLPNICRITVVSTNLWYLQICYHISMDPTRSTTLYDNYGLYRNFQSLLMVLGPNLNLHSRFGSKQVPNTNINQMFMFKMFGSGSDNVRCQKNHFANFKYMLSSFTIATDSLSHRCCLFTSEASCCALTSPFFRLSASCRKQIMY